MTDLPRGHRDYLDQPERTEEGEQPQPTPGAGTVWVNFDGERWWGSWQSGAAARDFHSPDESAVMQWAWEQPAAERFRFDPEGNGYVAF